ncbi:MAG: hypothetical protein Q4B40_06170, partial [Clostridia bacterium]|nr:hypothetical protein [Clostridia bacterium]
MKKTNRIMSMLLAVIMAMCMLPVSVFAADAATIVVNSEVIRYEESKAQVSFYPTSYDSQSDWQYYYIVSQQDTEKTADDVKNGGTATDFDENSGVATFDVTNLAEGVKYIHIVLVQKNDPTQVSNVLKLTIPEYVPLTIVPSADGYELESNNTLTIVAGTTVTFTTSESGCGMDYKEGSKVGPDLEFVGDEGYIRTATFSEIGTYTIEASINYKTAECSVIVVDELLQHYTLTFDYSIPNENEIEIGAGITDKTADFEYGTVVDLSEYWPSELTDKVEETTYYFAGFTKKDDIKILDSVAVDSNIVLEAAWVTQEKITITFETQGGDLFGGTRKSRVNKGCDFGTLNGFHIPTREDYVFTGWCLKNIGLPEDDLTELTEDTTVYAIWKWNRQPGSAWWSTNVKGKAEWTPVDGIDGYIVTLYEAQSEMGIDSKKVSADVTNYTFNNLVIFDETKSFYFTVQACLESLKSNETKSDESKPFTITSIDGAIDSAVKVIEADGEISVPVKVINQGGSRVALTDDVFAFIGKKIDVPVANADKLAISKTAIKANLGISGEDAEITLDDAKIILADWREIVNTAEGEEQIKSLLPNYSIYELALLIQANNIIGPDDDTEEKLNRLINDERERQKEAAANTQISFSETKVAMDAEALLSIEKNLADGEYVAISAEKIDVTGLADDEVLFDSGILIGGAGIFTEQ